MAKVKQALAHEGARQPATKRGEPAAPRITPVEATWVEEFALFYEQVGFPRMAGRIMGWLLICEPPHQSLAQLEEVLQASKGSISTMTRLLTQLGMLKRTSVPGERRDYVSIPPGSFAQLMSQQVQRVTTVRTLADRGLEVLKGARPERLVRLREMHHLYGFLEREMPLLLERWRQEAKRTKSN